VEHRLFSYVKIDPLRSLARLNVIHAEERKNEQVNRSGKKSSSKEFSQVKTHEVESSFRLKVFQ